LALEYYKRREDKRDRLKKQEFWKPPDGFIKSRAKKLEKVTEKMEIIRNKAIDDGNLVEIAKSEIG
jgi:hypothetical protein